MNVIDQFINAKEEIIKKNQKNKTTQANHKDLRIFLAERIASKGLSR